MPNPRLALAAALSLIALALGACDKGHQSGAMQKTKGHIEFAVGGFTGSESLKHQGKTDEVVGGVKSVAGDVKDTVKDAVRR